MRTTRVPNSTSQYKRTRMVRPSDVLDLILVMQRFSETKKQDIVLGGKSVHSPNMDISKSFTVLLSQDNVLPATTLKRSKVGNQLLGMSSYS